MAQKSLREFDGKRILFRNLPGFLPEFSGAFQGVQVSPSNVNASGDGFETLAAQNPWVLSERLVVKTDQLIKRRGKGGLLLLNATWEQAKEWICARMEKEITVDGVTGVVDHFFVEPFLAHSSSDELYVCIQSNRGGEEILFYHQGGVDVGDVDSKAVRRQVPVGESVTATQIEESMLQLVPEDRRKRVAAFLAALFLLYRDLHFCYLEINPLVALPDRVVALDMAAKLDETASYVCGAKWGDVQFPPPFGRRPWPEEAYIHDMDGKTGASLKLTILNPRGRVWTMVAGGGASVVYADTISDLGFGHELANYGEYSGAPTEDQTYEYAKTVLQLMTRGDPRPDGKVLIIGGGIANFTDVAQTFKGIVRAMVNLRSDLQRHRVSVWVRRGGPNYQEGMRMMREVGARCGISVHVYGPHQNIVSVVPMALGLVPPAPEETEEVANVPGLRAVLAGTAGGAPAGLPPVPRSKSRAGAAGAASAASAAAGGAPAAAAGRRGSEDVAAAASPSGVAGAAATTAPSHRMSTAEALAKATESALASGEARPLFHTDTRAIIYGMQPRAVQGMMDFDFICKRARPSVAAMVFPFSGNHYQKFYWGAEEVLIPVYQQLEEALRKHPDVDVMVNFASFRSVLPSVMEALQHSDQLRTVAIIAEGVPEAYTRQIIQEAEARGVVIIGPATVGGIKPGCFRIGNSGGMIDNLIASKLYRRGSVAYVSKSGGMSNELNNIIMRHADGVYEGIAIGGDRYPGTRFIDHLLRFHDDPAVKLLVLLGEVGGQDEYDVCRALQSGRIRKPIVAWCIGTCAKMFPFEVQFGHAGALANAAAETADAKNRALREAGACVPESFDKFGDEVERVFRQLVERGVAVLEPEPEPPKMPMDFSWAKKLGLIRKPASFVSTICDDRGEELLYAGMPISKVFEEDIGLGGVVSLLWFQRRLPAYATKFIEMVLMVTADHGPAVSGAHNTIVTSRAGKDLISSLCSGLLTIGPRFGGALDEAAITFSWALDKGLSPKEFVTEMRRQSRLIMGIGHRVKSLQNPDMRVNIVKDFAHKHFPRTDLLDYALEVEQITTQKKANLILNVDGAIACAFVDLLRSSGAFTREEADENIKNGCLNGLFVLGRSIGFIGHYLDQKRLKQGLYRHPWDDISYINSSSIPASPA